jgi:hypothetical protein
MSKQKKEPAVVETAEDSAPPETENLPEVTEIEETTATETPPEETVAEAPPEEKPVKSEFVCPCCQHTSGVKIGDPHRNGEALCQWIKCAKCNHIHTEVLA